MDEGTAMRRAAALAARAQRTSPNPKVGCVILDRAGALVGEGFHRGAGSPHAEIEALRAAGPDARGATAVVTLEPCTHTGRTGPCAAALIDAGVVRVVIGRRDPNPVAAGGRQVLSEAGIEVVASDPLPELEHLNRYWEVAVRQARPVVIWKTAATLDGFVAAADGTSRWITGPLARAEVHALRAEIDAVMVGTGTALADDPHLTVRAPGSYEQPLRVVVGERELPRDLRVFDGAAPTLQIREHDPATVLRRLWEQDARSVILEGGPSLAAAFTTADLIDFIVWFTAPMILGAGKSALAGIGAETLSDARRFTVRGVRPVGADVRIDLVRKER